jgi:O-antigen/teichoic acid export membrane protein
VGVFWFTRSLIWSIAALAIAWTITILCYDARVVSQLVEQAFFKFRADHLKRLLVLSFPLGLVMTISSLNSNIPRYILERKLGTAELGIFASLAYLLTAMNLVVIALAQSVCTRLSRLFADNELDQFRSIMRKLIMFAVATGTIGGAVAAVAGGQILRVIYRPEYARHVDLLVLLVAASTINAVASFSGFGLTAARCFRAQVPMMLVTAITTVALTLLLVPHFGLIGAGYALITGAFVQAATSQTILNFALRKQARLG